MDLFDLTGKVAMVTGSTKGLGETSAKVLANAGVGSRRQIEGWIKQGRIIAVIIHMIRKSLLDQQPSGVISEEIAR